MNYYSLVAFALLLSTIASGPSGFDENKGLVAYYSFNDCDARDETGNESDGTLYGNMGCWCGIEDEGLLFDGIDDYVEFGGIVNRYFSTSDFTVSFYFKANQYSVLKQSLLSKRVDCENYNTMDFRLDQNFKRVETYVDETPEKNYGDISPDTGGEGWKQVVLSRRGTRAYTYINGILMKEGFRCSGIDLSNDALLSFSNSPCIWDGHVVRFKGILDELRVYDRALTDEEVLALYLLNPIERATQDCAT
ncbi:MAG: hypothetical protein ACI8P3_003347 [Saprospiraceae bacterium]|jgi:hypothetical protein